MVRVTVPANVGEPRETVEYCEPGILGFLHKAPPVQGPLQDYIELRGPGRKFWGQDAWG